MEELAHAGRHLESSRVFVLGGGSALLYGWRDSTVDADLYTDREELFANIQAIKEKLKVNVELVRPEHFVPALEGTEERHLFIKEIESVSFFHYDPYAQLLSKLVRGFAQDLSDARHFLDDGLVDSNHFRDLVIGIDTAEYAKYPVLSKAAVLSAVDDFLSAHLTQE